MTMHEGQIRANELKPTEGQDPPLVLIVDDHVESAAMASDILSFAGCWTVVADSVEAAIEQIHRERPSLVVTDILMPMHTGVDLIEALQGSMLTERIPILACTARADVFEPWLREHHLSFLPKPYSPRELVDAVRAAVQPQARGISVEG